MLIMHRCCYCRLRTTHLRFSTLVQWGRYYSTSSIYYNEKISNEQIYCENKHETTSLTNERSESSTSLPSTMPESSPESYQSTDDCKPIVSGSGHPVIISSSRDLAHEEQLRELCLKLEEKRCERQQKLFENLLVFDGGAVADHESVGSRLIMRDYTHFALYNARYGYFPRLYRKYRAEMTSGYFDPIPWGSLRNEQDYELYVNSIHKSTPTFVTPTQLFQPYYGWVLAEYLVTTYRAKFDPREPLIIYDVGASTGALALSILDYLAEHFPLLYEKCEYHVIEMNPHLIQVLRNKLIHHYHHVRVHHLSMLNWHALEQRRCVILAIELLSGMPHDSIIWDSDFVCSEEWFHFPNPNDLGTIKNWYQAARDPLILRYLRYLNWMQEDTFYHLKVLCLTEGRDTLDKPTARSIKHSPEDGTLLGISKLIWVHSPLKCMYLPTATMLLLEMLSQYFPRHHCLFADWNQVPYALPGHNGPLLQIKLRIGKDLYLRRSTQEFGMNAGMVNITFPTNFDDFTTLYQRVCGAEKEIACMPHPEFWRTYGGDKTALYSTRSGFNPLLNDFKHLYVFAAHHPAEL